MKRSVTVCDFIRTCIKYLKLYGAFKVLSTQQIIPGLSAAILPYIEFFKCY